VLVEKVLKKAGNGQSYSIWKLGDLSPTDYTVTVFLFGQAHLDWYREPEGTIWAVVDGRVATFHHVMLQSKQQLTTASMGS
jgi:hypothetical protein